MQNRRAIWHTGTRTGCKAMHQEQMAGISEYLRINYGRTMLSNLGGYTVVVVKKVDAL